jgi:thymidylate synthase (FAD)
MSVSNLQQKESEGLRGEKATTYRAVSPGVEEVLYQPLKALDHGFVRVVDYMGDDDAIVQAARVSYGRGTKKANQDRGLINYLMRHWHTTPFEMCEIKFHIKLPIFVARQWIRHRTANVNEYSARYSIMGKEFYVPKPEHLSAQSNINKQGRGDVLTGEESQRVLQLLEEDSKKLYDHYQEMLNEDQVGNIIDENKTGLARELARMNLSLNYYTEWYWKIDLNNLLHFLNLRADSHAQFEIREYADIMLDVVKKWVPITYDAFVDYRQKATNLSEKMTNVVKRKLQGEEVTYENSGLTKREWQELSSKLF